MDTTDLLFNIKILYKMKTIKTILTVLFLFLLYSSTDAQGKCHGDNIQVYKGGKGCGCQCLKECVTPAELPVYLANGWNTDGCWNCCKLKWWVDAGIPKTSIDEIYPNAEPGSLTVSFTLASASDVKIQVLDLTGRCVATVADEYREDLDNELIWDHSGLNPGMYLLQMQSEGFSETKKVLMMN
jgi:hypothetical protein